MPIRAENRDRYPPEWPAISKRIREERAQGLCECKGECGIDHGGEFIARVGTVVWWDPNLIERCAELNGAAHTITGSTVVLTVAHLDHTPENVDDDNLRAMCQRCHLAYDRAHHAETRILAENKRRREMGDLFT